MKAICLHINIKLPTGIPNAFGSLKNGRNFSAGSGYRFGFNGKETDGETGTQDYGMRIYNPNIGKFLSLDPITKIYPMLTPYQFASNNPILNIDLDGLEGVDYTRNIILYSNGKPRFSKDDANNISKIPLYTFQISSTLFIIHNGKQISYNLSSAPTKMDLIFSVGPQAMTDIKFFSDNLLANKSNLKAKVSAATGYTDTKESKILENGFVNTFRHFAWQSTISMALGEKKAKSVGDYHEADGIKNKQKGKFWKDNVIDIANNEYARQYGKGFNFELVTRTAESYTNYLNGLAKHICSTVDGYATDKSFDKIRTGEVKLFNKTDPQVKSIYYGARSLKNTPVYVK